MQDLMPLFKRALYRWAGYVKMNTGATTYQFENAPNGEFTLIVGGPGWSVRKFFSRMAVFGTTARKLPQNHRMKRRTCDIVTDLIKEANAAKEDAVHDEGRR